MSDFWSASEPQRKSRNYSTTISFTLWLTHIAFCQSQSDTNTMLFLRQWSAPKGNCYTCVCQLQTSSVELSLTVHGTRHLDGSRVNSVGMAAVCQCVRNFLQNSTKRKACWTFTKAKRKKKCT